MSPAVTPSRLLALGHDDGWSRALAAADVLRLDTSAPGLARVTRTDRGACDLLGEEGPWRGTWGADLVAAVARDPLAVPSTGDWVAVQLWPDGQRTVEAVLPRRTVVVRAQVGGTSAGQVLAANVDVVAVVEGLYPDPDLARVERLMALAWESGARPRLVLTKGDLGESDNGTAGLELALEIGQQVAAGCEVDVTGAPTGTGLQGLRTLLTKGATIALVGASGVGKSTLLNALVGRPDAMRTQTLGAMQKGRHTTVTRELHLAAGGGCLIDTPGLRRVGLVGEDGLAEAFADVYELSTRCRFTDCEHGTEPGCAVREAIETGELAPRRLASWDKLRREAAWRAGRADVRLRQEQLRVWKQRTRAYRQRPGRGARG